MVKKIVLDITAINHDGTINNRREDFLQRVTKTCDEDYGYR